MPNRLMTAARGLWALSRFSTRCWEIWSQVGRVMRKRTMSSIAREFMTSSRRRWGEVGASSSVGAALLVHLHASCVRDGARRHPMRVSVDRSATGFD